MSDQSAETEGEAIRKARQAQLKKPKRHQGHRKYGNPEREPAAKPIVKYPTPLADMPDWMRNILDTGRGSGQPGK